jgi:hypothetical protein
MDTLNPMAIVQICLALIIALLCGGLLVLTRQARRGCRRRSGRKRGEPALQQQETPDQTADGAEREAHRLSIHHNGGIPAETHPRGSGSNSGSNADRVN